MKQLFRSHLEKIVTLTDDEFEYVMSHFSLMNFKKRDFLITEGKEVKNVFWVVSGLLKLDYEDDLGKQHVIAFAMEDWWEADFFAFFNQSKATMSLQALEDTQVLCLTLDNYNTLRKDFHKMTYFFLEKANKGHISSQQRILELISTNAKERYDKLLKRYPILLQRASHTLIASYLGVTRETLSRLSEK
ncbi:Crp cAMP-binding proteins - catabolite gene activator and regulatory subunit of cAMP-dependent protein kinases [Flavobacteriaceae bacterium]